MAGSKGAIEAGRAFVELFVEDNKAYRGLDAFAGKFRSFSAHLKSIGVSLGSAGGGVLGPLVEQLKEATERASGLQRFSDRVGESVTVMSALAGGAERAGMSLDSFQGAVEQLKVRVGEAADANDYLLTGFHRLGTGAQLAGLPTRDLLNQVANSISRVRGEGSQLRAAKYLGLDGLLPQLKKGKAGIDELFAAGAPGALSESEGRAALETTRALDAAWGDMKDTLRSVGLALLPTAAELVRLSADFKAGLTAVREWIKENRAAVVAVAAVGTGLVAAGAAAVGVGTMFAGAAAVITGSLVAVKATLGLLFSPVALLTAGFAAAGAGIVYLVSQTEMAQKALSGLGEDFRAFTGRMKESFGGISDAIGAGDWTLAFQIGLATMKSEWAAFNVYLQVGWNLTKGLFVDGWHSTVAGLKVMFNDLAAFILRNTEGTLKAMLERMAAATSKVSKKLAAELRNAAGSLRSDAQIDAGRDASNKAIETAEAERQRAATASRTGAADKATADAAAAKREVDALNEKARRAAYWASLVDVDEFAGEGGGRVSNRLDGPARLASAVKGIGASSSAIGQQLAFGDNIPQQQLDAQRSTAANTSQIPQMARDINQLARGGRVGQ